MNALVVMARQAGRNLERLLGSHGTISSGDWMRSSVVISPRSRWSRSSISWAKRAIAGSSSGNA
eukprot:689530-Rhodomonas_salina.1